MNRELSVRFPRPSAFLLKGLLISVLLLSMSVDKLCAQTMEWEDFLERLTVDEETSADQWDELAELHAHPFNLNTATREQLEQLPFLSPVQISHILTYLHTYGPLTDFSELQLVAGVDYETRAMLSLFVVCRPVEEKGAVSFPWREVLRHGRQEAVARVDIPFYYRKGYYTYPPEVLQRYPNRRYLGSRFYHSLRYRLASGERLTAGFTLENDAGEPFFAAGNKGYDYASAYVLLHDVGPLHTVALGDYRLRFGQGLVVNTRFSSGKQTVMDGAGSRSEGITRHASTNEQDYLRGLAVAWQKGGWGLAAFYSFRRQDATLKHGFITALKTDGLHRTRSEMEKKHDVHNQLTGIHLSYDAVRWHIGLTGVYTVFDKVLKPQFYYQQHDPRGRQFAAVGADYRLDLHRWSFAGETAVSGNGAVAALHTLAYRPLTALHLLLLHRHYAKDYEGIFARSFGEGSRVRNEDGLYAGLEWLPGRDLKLTAYTDWFRFPAPRYRVSFPRSKGTEAFVQLVGKCGKKSDWLLRYRYKQRERDVLADRRKSAEGPVTVRRHTGKGQWRWQATSACLLKTTLDYVQNGASDKGNEQGYQLTQAICLKPAAGGWECETGGGYFHTDGYDTRIYAYERGLLYTYSFPAYEGRGVHGYLWGRYDINSLLTVIVKYVYTGYFDRDRIGSGTQEIEGRNKQDLYVQLKVTF